MPPKGSKMKPSMAPNSAADPSRELPLAYTTFTVPPPLNAKSESARPLAPVPLSRYASAWLTSFSLPARRRHCLYLSKNGLADMGCAATGTATSTGTT